MGHLSRDRVNHNVASAHGVATVTLQRPEAYNSLTAAMVRSLLETTELLEADDAVKVIILTGSGDAFCAGQGLDDLATLQPDGGRALIALIKEGYSPLVSAIMMSWKPYIAAVNGVAAGAGFGIACACDFRIVSEAASFTTAFIKIGLVPDCGLSFTLPRITGYAKAVELCMLSERISARDAETLGLCTKVVAPTQLLFEAEVMARSLASGPRAIGLIKRELLQNGLPILDAALRKEALLQQIAAASSDFVEGIDAFRAKRRPIFN